MKLKWLLIIGLLLVSLAMPVMAVTGSFDSVGGLVSTSYTTAAGGGIPYNISGLYIKNIQNQTGFNALFMTAPGTATNASGTRNVNLYAGDTIVGSGQFGYSYNAVSLTYSAYLFVTSFNPGTMTGNCFINFTTMSGVNLWNLNGFAVKSVGLAYPGLNGICFASLAQAPAEYAYIKYQSQEFHNTWTTSYSSPLSTVNVNKWVGANQYPSKVYVMQGTTVIASNTTFTNDDFASTFGGVPYYTINATDLWGNWYVSELIYGSGTAPVYTISVLPANITTTTSASGGITSVIDPLLNGISDISWKWYDETSGYHNFYVGGNLSRPAEYSLKSGTWYGYDSTLNTYSITQSGLPNPTTLSGITSTGAKTIYCYIFTSDGNFYTLTSTLTVGGAGAEQSGRVLIRAIDWRTNDQVIGAAINIKNLATGVWSNETTVNGRREYYSSIGTRLYLEAYKSGYDRANVPMYQIQGLMDSQTISMFPTGSGSSGIANTTLYVMVGDYDTLVLGKGYSVRVVDDGQFKVTPDSGTVSFIVANNSQYTVSVGCSANQCYSGTKTETVTGSSYVMQFYLVSVKAATPTPTLAPGQTATPTAVPTLDTRTNAQKGGEMVDFLYDNGYTLVVILFIAALVGAFKMMSK